jgi:DNA polymerase III delta prime subunit
METSPWVEKYRPNKFEDIVLTPINKKILENIIKFNYFPNLLFYGPPGTGKTTTIINLIDKYQETFNQKKKGLIIHLNASDDRGIDIIRNQIYHFVNTKTLFGNGMKFIILDEVDYMTKNAQQALHYLIQKYNTQIRFCLICNYISRIDSALQNEFIRLRFCQLPKNDIFLFLKNITEKENLSIKDNQLQNIQAIFKSDIRSMINFLQSNHTQIDGDSLKIISAVFWEKLLNKFKNNSEDVQIFIQDSCVLFNINIVTFLKKFLLFIIRNKTDKITKNFLILTKNITHNIETNEIFLLNYFVVEFVDLQNEL